MQEKIKNIIAPFLKQPVDSIHANTVIDRTAVASSILLHRMYANLEKEGIVVNDYWDIKSFGDLLQKVQVPNDEMNATTASVAVHVTLDNNFETPISVGIDIEAISLMPIVDDYRADVFYTTNFTDAEIAYSILQPNPLATFAGLFAAKEAIIKADNAYIKIPFNKIAIDHVASGKPVFNQFSISIAHTNEYATAVAIPANLLPSIYHTTPTLVKATTKNLSQTICIFLSIFSFILAVIALFIVYNK
jgi:phosphopantetheine--protein transferase-like protein